jgi:hypothetical protein
VSPCRSGGGLLAQISTGVRTDCETAKTVFAVDLG